MIVNRLSGEVSFARDRMRMNGHEFLSHAMCHSEMTMGEGESQGRGFFFRIALLQLNNAALIIKSYLLRAP